ncbi:ATP-binding protein [Pseudomonas fluorescens]|jgi:predicted ATPase|uniref:ATP-dependent nuclease n=1 Tax=Pseudomonas TaxID=286 RepID=UPI00143D7B0A|nr:MULTISPECIES: ATP-binding protein [Pseudomonas]NKI45983.1 ATP-binding protein [Pseudomonas fluorescens]MBW4793331.1 AAA family ATPase [Pseudomonas tolaasii]NKI53515.1 ATP-binding protein [Pseudomonas fluorescens]NKI62293.1 ATP-binding protein [Pseudomonas fluorescens]WLG94091.1 AAA family ATPase [Pseudomonas sp. FP198]
MRLAAIDDAWRDVLKIDKYPCRLIDVRVRGVAGFKSEVDLNFKSAITAICGKNGVGKTTLIKFLYSAFIDGNVSAAHSKFAGTTFDATIYKNHKLVAPEASAIGGFSAYYLEPSRECTRIIEYLRSTDNVDELLEGVDDNRSFNEQKFKSIIENIVGKSYQSIIFYEIADAMPHEYGFPFPYFEVTLPNGSSYTNTDMGMGELSCLYVTWFIYHYIEPQSLLFIEEPENFISAYSQLRLMDLIADRSFSQKLWVILSTHSEHILSKVGIENIRILSQYCLESRSAISNPKHVRKYLSALGLSSNILGIYIVEDELARFFLEYILDKSDPDMLTDFPIIQMRCDSNIEKIVKHFEPTPNPPFEILAVLDADQSAIIKPLSGKHIYVTALPSARKLTPELELWSVLDLNLDEIAQFLDIGAERLKDAVEEVRHGDHHDRYAKISNVCRKSKRDLVDAILRKWYQLPENEALAKKFYLAIKLRKEKLAVQRLVESVEMKVVATDFTDHLETSQCTVNCNHSRPYIEAKIGFDGSDFFA